MQSDDYQGVSIMNYADREVPYTRILEPKHFYREKFHLSQGTVAIREYSCDNPAEPYYPVRLKTDQEMLVKYQKVQNQERNVIFGGYYNMDQVISRALEQVEELLKGNILK
jgi:UDP-galactopyranose mutase